jgi:hypothetical protein
MNTYSYLSLDPGEYENNNITGMPELIILMLGMYYDT